MAQYDVYPNPAGIGYLVDLQTNLLEIVTTRVVAPLVPQSTAPTSANRLNPVFEIDGEPHILVTQSLSAVPSHILINPAANLSGHFDQITNALDMLFQGF